MGSCYATWRLSPPLSDANGNPANVVYDRKSKLSTVAAYPRWCVGGAHRRARASARLVGSCRLGEALEHRVTAFELSSLSDRLRLLAARPQGSVHPEEILLTTPPQLSGYRLEMFERRAPESSGGVAAGRRWSRFRGSRVSGRTVDDGKHRWLVRAFARRHTPRADVGG